MSGSSVWTGRPLPGRPWPLGASFDGAGINVAVFSAHATRVDLCLFESPDDRHEVRRISLPCRTDDVFHGHLPGALPGLIYGLRVHGPFAPEAGHLFNPRKIVLDPWARGLARHPVWTPSMQTFDPLHPDRPDQRDDAADAPLGLVVADLEPAEHGRPQTPWDETLIYELHVGHFTRRHPGLPERLRGTYAGLATEPVIQHLHELGVTAIELLPVAHRFDEPRLTRSGRTNVWGYNPLSFFAPDPRFSSDHTALGAIHEFRAMTRALHQHHIEVILDVVFNHSCEGGREGVSLSLRGLDNATFYHLDPADLSQLLDFTGCGNSLNLAHPRAVQLVLDALRWWVEGLGVDGFRFDLASTMGRTRDGFDPRAPLLVALDQDPVLSRVKRIAEPWDVGPGGYQLGGFPAGWVEWNDQFRDTARRFWRGDTGLRAPLVSRLAGSQDIFAGSGRGPLASLNFITCHDGFTLHDLVSYEQKHNELNGENNKDGTDTNNSFNCGHEGKTEEPAVVAQRRLQSRNLLATLMLAQGVPMLLAGDELGRSQNGNNNAYVLDDKTVSLDWEPDQEGQDLLHFVRRLAVLRRRHPALRRKEFLTGRRQRGASRPDVEWFEFDGRPISGGDWGLAEGMLLARFAGDSGALAADGLAASGDDLLLILNGDPDAHLCRLPPPPSGRFWRVELDTAAPHARVRRHLRCQRLLVRGQSCLLVVAQALPHRIGTGQR